METQETITKMTNAGKKLCKCGRYWIDNKYDKCYSCHSERPLAEHLKGYKKK